jgi:DUSP domain
MSYIVIFCIVTDTFFCVEDADRMADSPRDSPPEPLFIQPNNTATQPITHHRPPTPPPLPITDKSLTETTTTTTTTTTTVTTTASTSDLTSPITVTNEEVSNNETPPPPSLLPITPALPSPLASPSTPEPPPPPKEQQLSILTNASMAPLAVSSTVYLIPTKWFQTFSAWTRSSGPVPGAVDPALTLVGEDGVLLEDATENRDWIPVSEQGWYLIKLWYDLNIPYFQIA